MTEYTARVRWVVFRLVHGGILALDDSFSSNGYETKEEAIDAVWEFLGNYTDRFILPETRLRRKDEY